MKYLKNIRNIKENVPDNNGYNRTTFSKLKIKTPERRHYRQSGVFIANLEQISHINLIFPLLNLNK